jgi:hypothetical protein
LDLCTLEGQLPLFIVGEDETFLNSEGLQDPPSGGRQQGPLVIGDSVKAQKFREGKGHHEYVSAPAAQFRRHFPFQETGVAARDDDVVAVLIVECPQDAAPSGQLLDFYVFPARLGPATATISDVRSRIKPGASLFTRGGKTLSPSHSAMIFFMISEFIVYCPSK